MPTDADKSRESEKTKSYEDAVGLGALIQMTMEIQKTIGELSGKVDSLGENLADLKDDTNKRLQPLERALWGVLVAAAILGVVLGGLGWMLSPFIDALATKLIS